jgi:uncharacterized membrane protein YcaP (DUF421 family)
MKADEIKWADWHRILFGESPPAYLLEVVVRVAIVYLLILIAMRVMGKRMTAEISRAELVARVSLAAAVGLPIQRPNRGLLGATVIVIVIVAIGRLLASISFKNPRFEKTYLGYYATLVKDGVLDVQRMKKIKITKERLFAALRSEGIRHLGQVKRFYIEANGKFSFVKEKDEKPGLSVIPSWDTELRLRQQQTDKKMCSSCGYTWNDSLRRCTNCGKEKSESAVLLPAMR